MRHVVDGSKKVARIGRKAHFLAAICKMQCPRLEVSG